LDIVAADLPTFSDATVVAFVLEPTATPTHMRLLLQLLSDAQRTAVIAEAVVSEASAVVEKVCASATDLTRVGSCIAPSVQQEMTHLISGIATRSLWTTWSSNSSTRNQCGLGVVVCHGHAAAGSAASIHDNGFIVAPLWSHRVGQQEVDDAGPTISDSFTVADMESFYADRLLLDGRFSLSVLVSVVSFWTSEDYDTLLADVQSGVTTIRARVIDVVRCVFFRVYAVLLSWCVLTSTPVLAIRERTLCVSVFVTFTLTRTLTLTFTHAFMLDFSQCPSPQI
jgi:hypothetical protein